MARRIADVRASFQVVAGPDVRDPFSLPVTLTELADGERLRIAVLAEPPGGATHPEIAAAVRSAADVLADAGHDIVEATPPMYDGDDRHVGGAPRSRISCVMRPMLDLVMGDDAQSIIANLLDGAPDVTVESDGDAPGRAAPMAMRLWSTFFAEHPILLSPTWAMPAFEHGADLTDGDELIRDTLRPVTPVNFLGLPAAVVPHGTADGLPVGVQVIGDRFTDLRCLDVAAQIEAACATAAPDRPGHRMTMQPWSVTAVNLPEHADNPIHTDAGARAAGFSGALVAGVTTYAAMTHVPATAWGRDWLGSGGAAVRFRHPILDGDRIDCVVDGDRRVTAEVDGSVRVEADFVRAVRDPIDHRSGEPLEPIEFVLDASWSDYGLRAGDDCPIYGDDGLAHPSSWPRIANQFCHEQLVTGPWIHVRSRIAHLGVAAIGAEIRAIADVVERIDSRAGERAILDVRITADGHDVAAIEHEAIISLA